MSTWREIGRDIADKLRGRERPQNSIPTDMSMSEFADWVKGQNEANGHLITERTAMRLSVVYGCVSLIGGAISALPLRFYRRNARTNDRAEYFPDEYWLFNEQPFPCWAAAPAWESATQSLLLQGDSFWRIHRASALSPKIVGVEPLHPQTVMVKRIGDRLQYTVYAQPSQLVDAPGMVVLDQDDILHVPGPGFNGLRGLSQVASALSVPGSVALAADDYVSKFFANSARPDLVLQIDGNMSREQMDALREQWDERYRGVNNSHRPAILQGGLKATPITMNMVDAQLIETRKFQVEDICRIFGVPPHMVGQATVSSWGTGIEQLSIGFVKYTLARHLVRFEQEINRKLFKTSRNFVQFDTTDLKPSSAASDVYKRQV